MATITLDAVKKSYGKTDVIHGVDVDIADGELIVIVGPSGCGKSTLLRMVAGLEEVTDGQISIDGNRVNEVEPKDRNIAMVFQTYALYPHMSVFDNMAYGLKIAGLSKEEIKTRVDEAARLLALGDLLDRKPKALSGGQRQRVAMGRAIVRKPAVFLFDEPLSNLDALLRVQMRLEIKQLQRRLNTTSLYVTHDQVEAMTLADRLVVMNGGVAEQIDTPMAVYERPASRFVASFIGSPGMNFLEGQLDADTSMLVLANGTGIRLPDANVKALRLGDTSNALSTGRGVVAGVRPEHLELAGEGAMNSDLTIEVLSVETLGADTLLHGVLAGSQSEEPGNLVDRALHALSVRVTGSARVSEGQTCGLNVALGGWHFFDAESGVRLQ